MENGDFSSWINRFKRLPRSLVIFCEDHLGTEL